jgi:tetratricopeptide (TPR) repeat protein
VHGNVVQAGSIGQITLTTAESAFPIPFQLPPPPRSFTSRREELEELERWYAENADEPALTVISGPGGVGKTTLALRWLHTMRDKFPDGQLFLDLEAFDDNGPVEPEQAIESFLLALGIPADRVPAGFAQRQALYRSMTADRALSLLLDNAVSAAQVRPLLPSSPRSVAVVTSRWRLSGLSIDGARFVEVDPLNVADSVALLDKVVGNRRISAERDEAEKLARLCGGMPIALSVVGARLSARPHRSVSREVVELRDKDHTSILSLTSETLSVGVVFDLSYDALPPEPARTYRLCALHPGPSFGIGVAAAMAEREPDSVEAALESLVERNLLSEVADRRFRYHDLMRVHARNLASATDKAAGCDAALRRMVEWYLDGTAGAERVLRPTRRRLGSRFQRPPDPRGSTHDHGAAVGWLLAERDNLIQAVRTAITHTWYDLVWELGEALWGFMAYTRHADWPEVYRAGAVAAHRCENPAAEARMRAQLGSALTAIGQYEEALRESEDALHIAERIGDAGTQADALSELAEAARGMGNLPAALEYLHRTKDIRLVIGTARALAQCRRQIGTVLTDLGRHAEAVTELREAAEAIADRDIERARVLTALGVAYVRWDHPAEAAAVLEAALEVACRLGSARHQADALAALGELAERASDAATARERFNQAYALYSDIGDPRAATVAARLGISDT